MNYSFVLDNFVDGPPAAGRTASFPFTIQLPNWLPPSMLLGRSQLKTLLTIEYYLRAQVTPENAKDWANKASKLSTFRGTRMIYVYRPMLQEPPVPKQITS